MAITGFAFRLYTESQLNGAPDFQVIWIIRVIRVVWDIRVIKVIRITVYVYLRALGLLD